MDRTLLNRRAIVRGAAIALTAGGAALAGCGDPDDEGDDGGGGGYRVEELDSEPDHDAGTSEGGSSAG